MSIQILQLPLGMLQTNCFIAHNGTEAIIIDPSDQAPVILEQIEKYNLTVKYILATHTHFDHVLASYAVKAATKAPFWLHEEGVEQLNRSPKSAERYGIPTNDPPAEPDAFINHQQIITWAGGELEARYTPGHSVGHLIFVWHAEKIAFVGDCVFRSGIGRTDLPGGNTLRLKQSIEEEILTLPDDYTLLTGHGPQTTIGMEKVSNPYIAQLLDMG